LPSIAVAICIASTVGGCILFVDDDPSHLTTVCHFSGDSTACGACIARACAGQVAACCGDASACTASLASCANGLDSQACGTLAAAQPDLGTCMTLSCAACFGGSADGGGGDARSPGSTECNKVGDSCLCSVGSPNGVTCNPQTLPGPGLCCADYGWPQATGTLCTCQPFSCTPSSSGYDCSLTDNSTLTTSYSGNCCASTGVCWCSDTLCSGSSNPLSECTVNDISCNSSQVPVSSCSF
jgi:hypothetical protein